MTFRLLAVLALVLSSTATVAADPRGLSDAKAQKAAVKCQKAIDQAGAKLVAAELKSIDACSTAVLACLQTKPADAKCLQKAAEKCSKGLLGAIPQAQVGATGKIVKACGTPLRPADLLASDGLGIGAAAGDCNADFGLNVCSDLPTLAQCLVKTNARGAERAFAIQQPRASELIAQVLSPFPLADLPAFDGCDDCAQTPSETLGKSVAACGAAVTKAGATFAGAVAKGLGGCVDKVFACIQTKPGDAKCLGKAAAGCDGAVAKLAAARTKLGAGINKKCADTGALPFATLAAAASLNLDALADDCAALGVTPLAGLADYAACVRRQHECQMIGLLSRTLPRTLELADAGLLGDAGDLFAASQCPAALPSEALVTAKVARAARAPRLGSFPIARFLGITKKVGGGPGVKASTVSSSAPSSAPNAIRRISFPLGAPSRFVPGSSRLVKIAYSGKSALATTGRGLAAAIAAPTMIIAVKRSDLVVEDHLEVPLDALAPGADGEVELEIDYDAAPPSCAFDLTFAVSEDGEVSDYTVTEQVSDTVPPPTVTPTPVPTATPTPTVTAGAGATATATPSPLLAYALTTAEDHVAPGDNATFVLIVTNLSNTPQNATLTFTVPAFTYYGAYGPGSVRGVSFSNLPVGGSQSAMVNLTVTDGASAPPDGTTIAVTFNDAAHGGSVARSITTHSAAPAELTLATAAATVAPGAAFTYALAFHNPQNGPLTDTELAVAVPAGATFVAAEGGVTPDGNGIVRWPLGTLAANATGRRTVTFAAAAGARGVLVVDATLRDGAAQVLATASAATAVVAAPVFAYTLTTIDDPVAPGGVTTFRLNATNLTNAVQNATLYLRVPDFTFYGAYGPGSLRPVSFSSVAAGASQSAWITLTVTSGAAAPPDGTLITLVLEDPARGAVFSRTIVADSEPIATLDLATARPTVAPGGTFAYTVAFHNAQNGPLADATLDVLVPTGATFVAAEDGVTQGADGVVRWPLGTLAANATGQRTVTFAAAANAKAALRVEATLRDQDGEVLTAASGATSVYASPVFAYALTTRDDLVAPAGEATFVLTATNLSNAAQDATLYLRVPDFTYYGAYPPGSHRPVAFGSLAAGASESAIIVLSVTSGSEAPPDGTLVTLMLDDTARGAAVTRTIASDASPAAELTLATSESTVAPNGTFAYTLAFNDPQAAPLANATLEVAVPAGATFVDAEGGIVPDADGVVRWPLGTLAGNTSGQRTVTFTADASARAPLVVHGTLRDGAGEVVTRASAATTVATTPAFAYTLTTTDSDPIAPGRVVSFLLTTTNLTNAALDSTVYFRVPDFTSYGAYGAGQVRPVPFGVAAAGESQTAIIALLVASGAAAPPDGSVITLATHDVSRAASVSRTVVAGSAGRAQLKVSTTDAVVAPGGGFSYTFHFHNAEASPLTGVELAVPVPADAAFFEADGGGTLGADGVVRWTLGTLAGNASGKVTVNLTAGAAAVTPLQIAATLRDGSAAILAAASAAMVVDDTPTFSYALTTGSDPVSPGQTASFLLSVENLTNTTQSATVYFRVPDFTSYGAYGAGQVRSVAFSNLAAGGSQETTINLLVGSGVNAPPSGTLIDLTTTDTERGASVSRTIVVN